MKLRIIVVTVALCATACLAQQTPQARISDLAGVEGVRDNPLVGYGLVVGLNGSGDRRQTIFTTQTLSNVLQRMGVQVAPSAMRVNNIAAVFVTANLPPFASAGTSVDVTVSSIGDAKSLDGGLLLLTPLYAADGQIYASAQGPLAVGGYSAGGSGASRQSNHPTVARMPRGALIERAVQVNLDELARLRLVLRDADFTQARDIAAAINADFGRAVATPLDARRVEIDPAVAGIANVSELLARVQNLKVDVHQLSKVVVNERTGTIAMGRQVKLSAVSVLHGNVSIEISSTFSVSQPSPMSSGETAIVAQPTVRVTDRPVRRIELPDGATVDELVNGLQAIGATARDVVSILQTIRAAGALQAELELI